MDSDDEPNGVSQMEQQQIDVTKSSSTSAIPSKQTPIPYHMGYAFNQKLMNYGFILKLKDPKLMFSLGFRQRRNPTSISKRFGVTSSDFLLSHPDDWAFRHQVEGMRLLLYHPNLTVSLGLESERFLVTFMETDNLNTKKMFSPMPRRRRFADKGTEALRDVRSLFLEDPFEKDIPATSIVKMSTNDTGVSFLIAYPMKDRRRIRLLKAYWRRFKNIFICCYPKPREEI